MPQAHTACTHQQDRSSGFVLRDTAELLVYVASERDLEGPVQNASSLPV